MDTTKPSTPLRKGSGDRPTTARPDFPRPQMPQSPAVQTKERARTSS